MSDLFNKLNKIKDSISSNLPQAPDSKAGMLGAAGIGGVLGALFGGSKNVQRTAKNVAVIGGSAALAALAYKMYQKWQNGSNGQSAPQGQIPDQGQGYGQGGYGQGYGGFSQANGAGSAGAGAAGGFGGDDPFAAYNQSQAAQQQQLLLSNDMGKLLLKSMVFAARADGHIDPKEQEMILSTAQQLNANSDLNNQIREYLNAPLDPNAIAQEVGSREQALDVYRLSAAAIVADNAQEQNYLNALARALMIDANTKNQLDQEAAQIRQQIAQS